MESRESGSSSPGNVDAPRAYNSHIAIHGSGPVRHPPCCMVDMPMRRTLLFERFVRLSTVLVVLLSLPVLGSAQTGQSPEALAKALQARYQSVRDFTADFVQIYRLSQGGAFGMKFDHVRNPADGR